MSSKRDKLIWKLYLLKKKLLFVYGCVTRKIMPYNQSLVDNLRDVYYGGIPLSVMLLSVEYCQGKCGTCATLMTFGFKDDDFRLVSADVDSIRLVPRFKNESHHDPNYASHVFVERILDDGRVFVYDTTDGFIYDRDLYYRMESPRDILVRDKNEVMLDLEYLDALNTSLETASNDAPSVLPVFESFCHDSSNLYYKTLNAELVRYKKLIGYDELVSDIDDDKRRRIVNYRM